MEDKPHTISKYLMKYFLDNPIKSTIFILTILSGILISGYMYSIDYLPNLSLEDIYPYIFITSMFTILFIGFFILMSISIIFIFIKILETYYPSKKNNHINKKFLKEFFIPIWILAVLFSACLIFKSLIAIITLYIPFMAYAVYMLRKKGFKNTYENIVSAFSVCTLSLFISIFIPLCFTKFLETIPSKTMTIIWMSLFLSIYLLFCLIVASMEENKTEERQKFFAALLFIASMFILIFYGTNFVSFSVNSTKHLKIGESVGLYIDNTALYKINSITNSKLTNNLIKNIIVLSDVGNDIDIEIPTSDSPTQYARFSLSKSDASLVIFSKKSIKENK